MIIMKELAEVRLSAISIGMIDVIFLLSDRSAYKLVFIE